MYVIKIIQFELLRFMYENYSNDRIEEDRGLLFINDFLNVIVIRKFVGYGKYLNFVLVRKLNFEKSNRKIRYVKFYGCF